MTGIRGRGERAGLGRQAVLEAAVRLVDREGLAKLTMRRLGTELGVEAMALYNHFPNKEALLDGLVEYLFSTVTVPMDATRWRQSLINLATALREILLAHPSLVPLAASRPGATPQNLRTLDEGIGALRAAGFSAERALNVLRTMVGLVLALVAAEAAAVEIEIDGEAYPHAAEALRSERATDPSSRFIFAVTTLLDGIEHTLDTPSDLTGLAHGSIATRNPPAETSS